MYNIFFMNLDLIIIIILLVYFFAGFARGMIQTFGSLVGIFAGAYVAGHIFEPVGSALSFVFLGNENLSKLALFVIILIIVNALVGIIFWVLGLLFKIISILPFVETFNRIGGAIFGTLEGILVISLTFYIALRFPIGVNMVEMISDSGLARIFLMIAKILAPLLPEAIQNVVF